MALQPSGVWRPGGAVLVVQDSVFFSYGQHPKTRGLGPIGKSNEAHERGLIMRNALAITASGVPLGSLSQSIWAPREVPEQELGEKVLGLQCTASEEKESSKWLMVIDSREASDSSNLLLPQWSRSRVRPVW